MLKNKKIDRNLIASGICFFFFALFLIFRSSYVISTALMLVTAICSCVYWWPRKKDKSVLQLSFYFLIVAIVWSHSFDSLFSWSTEGDFFMRYALAAFITLAFSTIFVKKEYLILGIACGAILSGIYALIQFPESGRANGYTNAIRFGNIALLMSVSLIIYAFSIKTINKKSIFLVLAALMGLVASFLSLSRGGWLFIFILPFLLLFFFQGTKRKIHVFLGLVGIFFISGLILIKIPFVEHRIQLAEQQVHGYFLDKERYVNSSVGARLEQWKMSWKLGMEKPFLGWGEQGVKEGRKQLVLSGEAHPTALNFPHTHHEFLEMWATRGIVGVLFLIFIYGTPLYIFFPTRPRLLQFKETDRDTALALYLMAICIPISYFVFGLTDVFFNLSIGHVFMIFSMIFIMSTLQGLKN